MKKALLTLLLLAIPSQAEEGACTVPKDPSVPFVPIRPCDLPPPQYLEGWKNSTIAVPTGQMLSLSQVQVQQTTHARVVPVRVSVLNQLIPLERVAQIRQLLQDVKLDRDPDTVDALPTYELFLFSPSLGHVPAKHDNDPARQQLRNDILALVQPLIQERLTPFVNQQLCQPQQKECFPCYSLIRRYQEVDRLSHAVHHDGHACVTAVVSLSDYDAEYQGGLYVSGEPDKRFLRLNQGDAVLHQFQLRHGVNVLSGTRYSLIVWYLDSDSCTPNPYDWFQECDDNPVCWHLQSTVDDPALSTTPEQQIQRQTRLLQKAAHAGVGTAAMKLGRAYAQWIPSPHAKNLTQARQYFEMAAETANDPEGYYGLAHLELLQLRDNNNHNHKASLSQVVEYLQAGAMRGHAFSMFNLGIAHLFGYGLDANPALAAEWFEQSGLPEGLAMASSHAESMGEASRSEALWTKALSLGYHQKWRKTVREQVGSGGTNGVDLNLPWPVLQGQRPPQF